MSLCIGQENTDTVKNQEMLSHLVSERTKELEEALLAKSRFLATMSHGRHGRDSIGGSIATYS
jgi:hypothetical protein